MQIVYHIGANCTDEDLLLKSLLKNAEAFLAEGIIVPPPGNYRRLVRETIQNLNGAPPAPDTRDILIDAIVEDTDARRLVMSHDAFICVPNRIFDEGRFYDLTDLKVGGLASLFPENELEIYIGIRNPATFVPAVFAQSKYDNFVDFLQGTSLDRIRWSDVVQRIQAAAPNAKIGVWCNEDTPMIWAQLIREISGVEPTTRISGGFDLLSTIMSNEGMSRFLAYIKDHPPKTELQKRRIIAAFLDKFAMDDQVEEELDLPGWSATVVERLSELYDEDVYQISHMPGVTFFTP